jgi:uncharacterized protein
MPLIVNLRHLASRDLRLKGELPVAELDLDLRDELVRADKPLSHDIEAQLLDDNLLVRGKLALPLTCECVRCLKPFEFRLEIADWTLLLPLKGDEATTVEGDCVDLTPLVREDILLAFPQHPLCDPHCRGLEKGQKPEPKPVSKVVEEEPSSTWAELDKLKL